MKNNRFFVINHDLSKNMNDQVFYYTRIIHKDKTSNDENSKSYPYYPFYLTFKPYRIDFNYYGPSPDFKKDVDAYQELKHNTIFSLPLSFDYSVNDRLTTKLVELFDEESKFDKCYQYNPDLDFKTENSEVIYSYNCLKNSDDDCSLPDRSVSKNRISHRILFLDFLFDFNEIKKMYNDFTYCSFFDEIETRLRQNDFFNALATKYSYYYNHQRLAELASDNGGQDNLIFIQTQINRFNQAANKKTFREECLTLIPEFSPLTSLEETKLKSLLKKHRIRSCFDYFQLFFRDKNWDKPQVKSAIFNEFISEYRLKLKRDNSRFNVELQKYAEVKDQWIRILEKNSSSAFVLPKNKWWKHFETELEDIYFVKNATSRISLLEKDEINRIETAKWFSNRFDVLKSFLLILGQPFGKKKLTQKSINFQILCMLHVYFGALLIITCGLLYWGTKNLSSVILYFSFSNIGLILLLTILFFFSGIVNNIIHKKTGHYKLSIRTAGFFLPRLLMAIISGWLFLAIAGEELWKFELDMRFSTILEISAGLLILMIFFLYLEIWKINPKSWRSAFSRAITMIYIGLMYSFIFGFFIMIFTSKKIIERSDLMEKFAYDVLASTDSAIHKEKRKFIIDHPKYFIDSLNKEEHFTSMIKFKKWISDSIYYNNFVEERLLILSHQKWNSVIKKQYELLANLDLLDSRKLGSIFLDSISNSNNISVEGQRKLLDDLYPIQNKSNNIIKDRIIYQLNDILNIRIEAFHEINNSLINFSYSKPLFDHYLIADFLTNVKYSDDLEIPLVQKVKLPFINNRNEKNIDISEEDKKIIIFPGYLILNSFLALFVGVFLQMIFDKKNIAEPL